MHLPEGASLCWKNLWLYSHRICRPCRQDEFACFPGSTRTCRSTAKCGLSQHWVAGSVPRSTTGSEHSTHLVLTFRLAPLTAPAGVAGPDFRIEILDLKNAILFHLDCVEKLGSPASQSHIDCDVQMCKWQCTHAQMFKSVCRLTHGSAKGKKQNEGQERTSAGGTSAPVQTARRPADQYVDWKLLAFLLTRWLWPWKTPIHLQWGFVCVASGLYEFWDLPTSLVQIDHLLFDQPHEVCITEINETINAIIKQWNMQINVNSCWQTTTVDELGSWSIVWKTLFKAPFAVLRKHFPIFSYFIKPNLVFIGSWDSLQYTTTTYTKYVAQHFLNTPENASSSPGA